MESNKVCGNCFWFDHCYCYQTTHRAEPHWTCENDFSTGAVFQPMKDGKNIGKIVDEEYAKWCASRPGEYEEDSFSD